MDTRFTYISLAILSLLGRLDDVMNSSAPGNDKGMTWREVIVGHFERCRNFDGGFGSREGSESHGGQGE